MRTTIHRILTAVLFVIFSHPLFAYEPGDVIVRVGPTWIEPNDDSNDVDTIPGAEVRVDNDVTPGFTIGYMFTSKIGIELLGVLPANHDLKGSGVIGPLGKIGEVDVFPPTLSLQYHFDGTDRVTPYVGAGVNYTRFSHEDTSASLETALGGSTTLDVDDSWGLAAQAGVDFSLGNSWLVNAAVWYIDIDADATLSTGAVNRDVDIDIDPWVFFVGIGKRF